VRRGAGFGRALVGRDVRRQRLEAVRVRLEGPGLGADAHDLDGKGVVGLEQRQHLKALDGAAEDGVEVVEARAVAERDEELAAVGGGAGVGHGEHADVPVAQAGHELVVEAVRDDVVAGVLEAGVAALDDEARDDAIPGQAGVEGLAVARRQRALGEADEAGDSGRGLLVIEFGDKNAARRGEHGIEAVGELLGGREPGATEQQQGKESAKHAGNLARPDYSASRFRKAAGFSERS